MIQTPNRFYIGLERQWKPIESTITRRKKIVYPITRSTLPKHGSQRVVDQGGSSQEPKGSVNQASFVFGRAQRATRSPTKAKIAEH